MAMELIRGADAHLARYTEPRRVALRGVLNSVHFGAKCITLTLDEVDAESELTALDRLAAQDLVERNADWFPQNDMTDDEVRASLRPTVEDGAVTVESRLVSTGRIVFNGMEVDAADMRLCQLPRVVEAVVRQAGIRIFPDRARVAWELEVVDLTPVPGVAADRGEDEEPPEPDPSHEACAELESGMIASAMERLAVAKMRARKMVNDAEEAVAMAGALEAVRGTAEWHARVGELEDLIAPEAEDAPA